MYNVQFTQIFVILSVGDGLENLFSRDFICGSSRAIDENLFHLWQAELIFKPIFLSLLSKTKGFTYIEKYEKRCLSDITKRIHVEILN